MQQPVTEQSNSITTNIDVASATDIVQLLSEADNQMFCAEKGLLNSDFTAKLELVVDVVVDHLQAAQNEEGSSVIVLSGCGTSGRLGFLTARSFNNVLRERGFNQRIFEYLISGYDEALFVSRELAEDDPHIGQTDLEAICEGRKKVLYLGITCGLSAPYVAGQLDFCCNNLDRFFPILIGFNPVKVARNSPIENWDKTFRQVAVQIEKFEATRQGFVINPIVGPEPITGSTRMKGGSATKIILDTLFTSAISRAFHHEHIPVSKILSAFQTVDRNAYSQADNLAKIVECAGKCLRAGGHIYYISSSEHLVLFSLVDASECKPTYGADLNDVRGFLIGGFKSLGNRDGDLSHIMVISTEHFESHIAPNLTCNDAVVVIAEEDDVYVSQVAAESPANKILLQFCSSQDQARLMTATKSHFALRVTSSESVTSLYRHHALGQVMAQLFLELACKLTCNILTTGAHVLRGKVYENYMIDVRVSNNKLYNRAVAVIQKFGNCDKATAENCLLRSIYDSDSLTDDITKAPISNHIKMAAKMNQVVPVAILLARLGCTVHDGRQTIASCPVVRLAIANCR